MVTGRELLIATSNRGKLREILDTLAGLDAELVSLDDFGALPEAVEDGSTFEENARKKAAHYAALTGLWTLADDSGLEVEALDGLPGVHSARFAGPAQDAAANNAKLVASLCGVPPERRVARFRSVIVVADAKGVLATASGSLDGVIIDEPRGRNGFGYDPHFLVPERGVTTAELDPVEKNRISHRGIALERLRPALMRALTPGSPA